MSGCPPTNIGPGASSRKTYDTDSLVMRRIFAYDPMTNTPLSTNYILSADVKGVVLFKNPLEVLSTFGWADQQSLLFHPSAQQTDIWPPRFPFLPRPIPARNRFSCPALSMASELLDIFQRPVLQAV